MLQSIEKKSGRAPTSSLSPSNFIYRRTISPDANVARANSDSQNDESPTAEEDGWRTPWHATMQKLLRLVEFRPSEHAVFVTADSLTKRYGPLAALENCSLTVDQGEVLGLLGPNGAGKTTLIRLLLGFLTPTSGNASIGGFDCHKESLEVRKLTAYLPGEARLFRTMRAKEVLEFFAGTRPGSHLPDYFAVAKRVDLDLTRRVANMSTGTRQKLALAITIAAQTPLMILDEPTANLDPTVRGEVITMVLEAKQAGRTVIFSSHVLSEVEEACDRVAILRSGRLVHTQSMVELRRRHRIHVTVRDRIEQPPSEFGDQLRVEYHSDRSVTIETANELAGLFAWLAKQRIEEVRIEPIGLRAVYDQYHSPRTPVAS